jgi:23S rRNA pseudouridine2605 synthase
VDGRDEPGHDESRDVMAAKPNKDKSRERVAKVIARAGLCSRREAEAWIAAGRVAVNGAAITSPALNVGATDSVTVDGKPLPARERTRLFLYHKPRGLVTTHADPQGRPTIFSVLPKHLPRLISVGRLDLNTEGLLLLTNDGGLARALELPQTGWLRRYRVRAHGKVTQEQLDALRAGITIDGVHYGSIEATHDRAQGANVWLTFAMREGKNREVKNVLGHLGLAVNRLIRISFGPFQLGELAEGAIEEVKTRVLREQIGGRVAALAGADFSAAIMQRQTPPISHRHPEVRAPGSALRAVRAQAPRASKDARPGPSPFEGRRSLSSGRPKAGPVGRPPQGDGKRQAHTRSEKITDRKGRSIAIERKAARKAERLAERVGGPELARREKKRGRRPWHGKR